MKKIICVIGARPQFIKHAPLEIALQKFFEVITIHTGQHYDEKMSAIFFDELQIAKPKYILNVGSGNHGYQTGMMMKEIEDILIDETPDAVLVYGDTNSTLAGALTAAKLNIKVIHIEAGLRSFNKNMPEEVNRILTDHVSALLFSPTKNAVVNLRNEGLSSNVFLSGDIMIDTLFIAKKILSKATKTIYSEPFILLTIHRPYNTDNFLRLTEILAQLNTMGKKIIFPTHFRTKNILLANGEQFSKYPNINFIEPISYFSMIEKMIDAECIITDSGGIQKEAYALKKKCITIRSETEWTETLENGWNTLVFDDLSMLKQIVNNVPGEYKNNLYGNGNASEEIAEIISNQI